MASGIGFYLWSRTGGPEPPGADLEVADPAVAQAMAAARQAVRQAPRSSEAWGQLGLVFFAHDYFAQADECLVQAERLAPREPRWSYYHALVLHHVHPEAVLPKLRHAVELWGDQPETPRLRLAETLLEQGQFEEAQQHFLRLLSRNVENRRAHYGLGRLSFERGDLPGSLYYLRQAVTSPFARRAAHLLLAKVYQRQGQTAVAAAELRQVAELPEDPRWPDPLLEPVQAVTVGRLARLRRVAQLVAQNQLVEAKAVLEPLVRDYPDAFQGWLWLGHVGVQENRLRDAEQALRRALRQAPDCAEASFMLGYTLLRLKQPDQAEPCLRQTIALKPADGNAHFELGRCLRAKGDRDGAIEAWRAAVRCKPHLVDAHLLLAESLAEAGQYPEAWRHVRNVLALVPEQEAARSLLSRLLAHLTIPGVVQLQAVPGTMAPRALEAHARRARLIQEPGGSGRFAVAASVPLAGWAKADKRDACRHGTDNSTGPMYESASTPGEFVKKRGRKLALAVALLVPIGLGLGIHTWAQLHYRTAERALARWAFAEAQQHLAPCLKVWFWGAQTHLLAARTARRAGAYEEAERYLRTCRELGGASESIYLEYLLLRARQGDFARVETQLVSRVLQGHPDSVLILEVLTPAYVHNYQLANAQECVRRWLEREPERLQAWEWQAKLGEQSLNHLQTLSSYRRLVELDPDNDGARLQLAGLLTNGHHPQEALEHFAYLRQKYGDTPQVLMGLVRCRRALNQPEEARQVLEKLLAENPSSWSALGERGRLALESESPAEAEKWFRQAVAVMPYEKDVNYGLYQCLVRLGKRQEAEEVRARLKHIEDDLSRLSDLTRTIATLSHDAGLRCEAGVIMLRNGQEAEGVRWLESALQEDPLHEATHRVLADYYQRTGDSPRAEQHRRLALGR